MDDTDRKLMLLMFEDPRMPVRELARRLGISRQAVHHHMQTLKKAGVFREIKAAVSSYYLDGVPVMVWGRSRATSVDTVLESLGETEFTTRVTVAGGNELFIFAYLRKISDLAKYVDFVRNAGEMPETTVGFPCYGDGINPIFYDGGRRRESYRKLSALDLKVIASLQEDARKPIADIAKDIGVSRRTVKRLMERMKTEGLLEFDSPWDIPSREEMVTIVSVTLKKDANNVKSAKRLLLTDPIHFIYIRAFGNLPSFLLGLISSDRMTEIRNILKAIREDEDVLAVIPNLIYFEREYNPWCTSWSPEVVDLLRPRMRP
ncbi:MAG TPA: winged helix-turn-helix transcriptional regulator [Thermoplasmata archaeon]